MKLETFKEKIKGRIIIIGMEISVDHFMIAYDLILEWIYKEGFEIVKSRREKK